MSNIKNYTSFINEKKWIQETDIKKGALKSMLGYKEDETIPKGVLAEILEEEVGSEIEVKGVKHKITKLMKKRANLANILKKMD
jgi:hypothetical protein